MSLSSKERIEWPQTALPPAVISGRILDWSPEGLVIKMKEPCPNLETVVTKINELLQLQPNWNSYRSAPISPKSAVNSLRLFSQVMYDETPAPQMVPTAAGNVQFEWHVNNVDLEIEVSADGEVHCFFADLNTGKEEIWSDDFNYALARLMPYVDELTSRELTSIMAA